MANYTTRLGRDAANAAQWGTKAGSLLGAVEIDYVSSGLNNRFAPAAFDVTRATSATRVNPSGLIEKVQANVPRICYLNDAKGELLVEPQRTNLITYSEEFDNAAWLKDSLTINSNQGIAPDGTSNSDLIIPNSTLGNRFIGRSATTGQNISSVFLKMKELRYVNFGNAAAVTTVDLQNGTISADVVSVNEFSIEDYGSGWYRVTCYNTISSNFQIQVFFGVDATGANITTNGTDGAYIWGAQLEEGGYPTSYIPTVASTVTRNADVISLTGASALIGQSEGSTFIELVPFESSASASIAVSLSDGTTSNRIAIAQNTGTSVIQYAGILSSSLQFSITGGSVVANQSIKIAGRYEVNNFASYIDGTQIGTDTIGSTFSDGTLNQVRFDNGSGGAPFYGRIRQLVVFDQALTNAELAAITS